MNEQLNLLFSRNLSYWLKIRGKKQADLCKRLGVKSSSVSEWCNGRSLPNGENILMICQWLMIELSDLLEDKMREPDILDRIEFKLKDDQDFKNTVADLYSLSPSQYEKVKDYIALLMK